MKRREFITCSMMGSLMSLALTNKVWSASPLTNSLVNDHAHFLKFLEKSKKQYAQITMSGIDPTVDFIHNKQNGDVGATRPGVAFFNDQFESAILNVPIFPHSIEQNPDSLNRIMLIPRRWDVCAEFDVVQNKVVSEISLKNKKFYGHGCYIPGTSLFYATTYMGAPNEASLALFDLKTNKIIKEIEIEGAAGAHQCSLSHDGKHVIVTLSKSSAQFGPSIVWLDVETGKVVERIFKVREHAEHFSELKDGYLIFTGGTTNHDVQTVLGSIAPNKQVNNFVIDKELLSHFGGLSVSICGIPEKEFSFMTNVVEKSVYVMNYKSGKLVKRIEVPQPRGLNLSIDKKFLFVTSFDGPENVGSQIFVIDVDKLEIVDKFNIKNALAYSSHAGPFKLS